MTADQKMSLPDSSVSRDVVALASDDRVAAVQLFQMRAGKWWVVWDIWPTPRGWTLA